MKKDFNHLQAICFDKKTMLILYEHLEQMLRNRLPFVFSFRGLIQFIQNQWEFFLIQFIKDL